MEMKKLCIYLWGVFLGGLAAGCSGDEEISPQIAPDAIGTFVDERDGYVYHYVRYGDQEWTCENSHYIISDQNVCSIYQPNTWEWADVEFDYRYYDRFGCLYRLDQAFEAVPEGWRLPTDEDWQKLERHFGMSADEAAGLDWRGNVGGLMKTESDDYSTLGIQCGGYYTDYTSGGRLGWRYMAVYGYYWTATQDPSRDSGFYFARKFIYNGNGVWRHSMEKDHYQLYVRFVRDVN